VPAFYHVPSLLDIAQRRACLIAGDAIARADSLAASGKSRIDLDQIMKGKRLDNLTIIQHLRAE
jgi:hypothetical protein